MLTRSRSLLALGLVALTTLSAAQVRRGQEKQLDLPATLDAAKTAWNDGRYGRCMARLQDALGLVAAKRAEAIRASLPAAPEGFEIEPERNAAAAQNNPLLAAVTASAGNVVQRKYKESRGSARAEVSVTADSPMVGMMSAWLANPAMLGADGEIVEYGAHKAVLRQKNGGRTLELQILIGGKHMVDVTLTGRDDEFLFGMFDQAAVDRLAAVLVE